ncbi:hypothetical protein FA10DRAFT_268514 [Acaromyces ingoldii]|uniref:Uncharacterized protein n=1 Tax=Acaromyces ingoldii TaxID=215250 RepID=A0A316YGM1_9BASI|nr:hypothetical protein FA10DRAFT_268514 [Acaromyces ingoldii]PWN88312.1 hypothetical protein FA10DRAFT_268514 [Acaromyces ingoldii]
MMFRIFTLLAFASVTLACESDGRYPYSCTRGKNDLTCCYDTSNARVEYNGTPCNALKDTTSVCKQTTPVCKTFTGVL